MKEKQTKNSKNIDNIVLNAVVSFVESKKTKTSEMTYTMTQLNNAIIKTIGKKTVEQWPGSPAALRVVLNRLVNKLRARKVSLSFSKTAGSNSKRVVKVASR